MTGRGRAGVRIRMTALRGSDWVRERLWFWPMLAGLAAAASAEGLVRVDRSLAADGTRPFWVFGGDADAARSVLTTIATSTMTVFGVILSITLAVLALTVQGYSPRVIRRFTRDRLVQAVIAGFTATFVFALVALRLVREGLVPGLTVNVAAALAFAVVALLIAFFHHLASEIRIERVVEVLWRETAEAIPRLLSPASGEPAAEPPEGTPSLEARAPVPGRVRSVDVGRLAAWAARDGSTVVVLPSLGDYVAAGEVIVRAFGPAREDDGRLAAAVRLGAERSVTSDVAFGLRQLVDIALRALSPSVNDPTTAAEVIARLADLLRRLARCGHGARVTQRDGGVVICNAAEWEDLLGLAFDQIAAAAERQADAATAVALLDALGSVLSATNDPRRVQAVRDRAGRIADGAHRAIAEPLDLARVDAAAARLVSR